MKTVTALIGLCMTLSLSLAEAASTVVVSSPVGGEARVRSTIEVFDNDNARIHVGVAPDYLLIRNDKLYSVDARGAHDITTQRQLIRLPTIGDENVRLLTGLTDTGRTEDVAGLTGKIYSLSYYDRAAKVATTEIVLSTDARARDVTAFWKAYADRSGLANDRGRDVLQGFLERNGLGVLRFGNDYQVEGFGVAPAADRFAVHARP